MGAHLLKIPVLVVLVLLSFGAYASDAEANVKYQDGLKESEKKNFYDAAKLFLDAEFMADTVSLKANSVKAAAEAYRKARLLYKEFECVEKLLSSYPGLVDFQSMIDREYEIGEQFFAGHRDPAYWSLRWVPWLKGSDRTEEIYAKVIKRAPFAAQAPVAQVRLAALMIDKGQPSQALKYLREVIEKHPDSPACKYAYLELGTALFELSQKGDGDGKFNQECIRVLKDFMKKYPDAPECDWAARTILKSKDIAANRILGLAKFYDRIGRPDPAERYLNNVLREYPDTQAANASEALLAKMDKTFAPESFRPEIESRIQSFTNIPIPEERSEIMVVPENSGGKWLLPVRDLGLGKVQEYRKEAEEK